MRLGPSVVIVLALVLSVGAALAGYLQAEVVSVDSGGTTFRATWSLGVTTDYSVVDRNGFAVSGLSPLVVNEGPNSCNDDHPVSGNGRAYFVSVASDDTGPQDPDGWVDCDLCDCEAVPGTLFGCQSNGRCAQCNACDDIPPDGNTACAARTDGNTQCEHLTCDDYDCICDTVDCADRTNIPSCRDSIYDDECDESERVSYTSYGCSGDSCVGASASRLCERDTDLDPCGTNGYCVDGSCLELCQVDCSGTEVSKSCSGNTYNEYEYTLTCSADKTRCVEDFIIESSVVVEDCDDVVCELFGVEYAAVCSVQESGCSC